MQIVFDHNLRLHAIPPFLYENLVERLKFPNPKYLENARMGRWNRGIARELKFFRKLRGGGLSIPRGYLGQLIRLCRQHGVEYRLEDRRRTQAEVELHFRGTLQPFQQEAVQAMLRKEFGTLSAPTGSGKTVMALFIIARRRQPALIVVHTRELARQWTERIEEFLGIPAAEVGQIGGGKKRIGDRITVALVQTLYRCSGEVAPRIGNLLVDECHRTPSRTFTEAVSKFDSRYMLGLSATPWRRDKLSKLIFWHLGDVHHQVDQARLVRSGSVLAAKVTFRRTDFKPFSDPVQEYSKMLSELTADDTRNRLIAADVAREIMTGPGVCLVLSDRRKHCESLGALLNYGHRVPAVVVTGDLSVDQRREAFNRILQGESRVLIATGQLIGEGFDCRELTTLFLATPVRFSGRVIQYLGRILRPAPGKTHARVFDYVDVHVEALLKAARARKRIYGR